MVLTQKNKDNLKALINYYVDIKGKSWLLRFLDKIVDGLIGLFSGPIIDWVDENVLTRVPAKYHDNINSTLDGILTDLLEENLEEEK